MIARAERVRVYYPSRFSAVRFMGGDRQPGVERPPNATGEQFDNPRWDVAEPDEGTPLSHPLFRQDQVGRLRIVGPTAVTYLIMDATSPIDGRHAGGASPTSTMLANHGDIYIDGWSPDFTLFLFDLPTRNGRLAAALDDDTVVPADDQLVTDMLMELEYDETRQDLLILAEPETAEQHANLAEDLQRIADFVTHRAVNFVDAPGLRFRVAGNGIVESYDSAGNVRPLRRLRPRPLIAGQVVRIQNGVITIGELPQGPAGRLVREGVPRNDVITVVSRDLAWMAQTTPNQFNQVLVALGFWPRLGPPIRFVWESGAPQNAFPAGLAGLRGTTMYVGLGVRYHGVARDLAAQSWSAIQPGESAVGQLAISPLTGAHEGLLLPSADSTAPALSVAARNHVPVVVRGPLENPPDYYVVRSGTTGQRRALPGGAPLVFGNLITFESPAGVRDNELYLDYAEHGSGLPMVVVNTANGVPIGYHGGALVDGEWVADETYGRLSPSYAADVVIGLRLAGPVVRLATVPIDDVRSPRDLTAWLLAFSTALTTRAYLAGGNLGYHHQPSDFTADEWLGPFDPGPETLLPPDTPMPADLAHADVGRRERWTRRRRWTSNPPPEYLRDLRTGLLVAAPPGAGVPGVVGDAEREWLILGHQPRLGVELIERDGRVRGLVLRGPDDGTRLPPVPQGPIPDDQFVIVAATPPRGSTGLPGSVARTGFAVRRPVMVPVAALVALIRAQDGYTTGMGVSFIVLDRWDENVPRPDVYMQRVADEVAATTSVIDAVPDGSADLTTPRRTFTPLPSELLDRAGDDVLIGLSDTALARYPTTVIGIPHPFGQQVVTVVLYQYSDGSLGLHYTAWREDHPASPHRIARTLASQLNGRPFHIMPVLHSTVITENRADRLRANMARVHRLVSFFNDDDPYLHTRTDAEMLIHEDVFRWRHDVARAAVEAAANAVLTFRAAHPNASYDDVIAMAAFPAYLQVIYEDPKYQIDRQEWRQRADAAMAALRQGMTDRTNVSDEVVRRAGEAVA